MQSYIGSFLKSRFKDPWQCVFLFIGELLIEVVFIEKIYTLYHTCNISLPSVVIIFAFKHFTSYQHRPSVRVASMFHWFALVICSWCETWWGVIKLNVSTCQPRVAQLPGQVNLLYNADHIQWNKTYLHILQLPEQVNLLYNVDLKFS